MKLGWFKGYNIKNVFRDYIIDDIRNYQIQNINSSEKSQKNNSFDIFRDVRLGYYL